MKLNNMPFKVWPNILELNHHSISLEANNGEDMRPLNVEHILGQFSNICSTIGPLIRAYNYKPFFKSET